MINHKHANQENKKLEATTPHATNPQADFQKHWSGGMRVPKNHTQGRIRKNFRWIFETIS